MGYYTKIHIKDLILWESNPRVSKDGKEYFIEKEAVQKYFKDNESQMRYLTQDIAKNGLSPNDIVVVIKEGNGKYKVFEGNRRISAIKVLWKPDFLDYDIALRNYIARLGKSNYISREIYCYVSPNKEEAHSIVEKTHLGINRGIGRVPWGTLEKQAFKKLNNQPNTTVSSNLLDQYPGVFDDIIDKLKPTNVDRILSKSYVRDIIETDKDYSGLDSLQQGLVCDILDEVKRITDESKRSIAYIFHNNDDVVNLLGTYISTRKAELIKNAELSSQEARNRQIPINIKLLQSTIYLEVGETYVLPENVEITKDIDINLLIIKSIGVKSAIITKDNIFASTNTVGTYEIQYLYPYNESHVAKVCRIYVGPKQINAVSVETPFLSAHFHFIIDINPPINELVNQLSILDIRKYNLVAASSLRTLIESSIKVYNAKYNLSNLSSFENQIKQFRDDIYNDRSKKIRIENTVPMTKNEINNFLQSIDHSKLASILNLTAHSQATYLTKDDLFDLANKVLSYILIFITILLR